MENGLEFDFKYTDLFSYGQELASKMQVPFNDGEIIFPEKVAQGYLKLFKINEFISYKVAEFTTRQSIVFNRYPASENHVIIVFRNHSIINIQEEVALPRKMVQDNKYLGSIQCKSTQTSEKLILDPGQDVKLILILMKEGWQQSTLHDSVIIDKFAQYFNIQNDGLNVRKEFLSPDQNKLFNSLFNRSDSFLSPKLHYHVMVINLLESFLKEVLNRQDKEGSYLFASFEDIRRLQKAEQYININLNRPFPGVAVLSRISCMCRTRFINLFQKVYGLSSFEYSQKKRLAIAFEYLKSGKHTVYETAQIIGYSSANNFSLAFKKEFGFLPSELLKKRIDKVPLKMPIMKSAI